MYWYHILYSQLTTTALNVTNPQAYQYVHISASSIIILAWTVGKTMDNMELHLMNIAWLWNVAQMQSHGLKNTELDKLCVHTVITVMEIQRLMHLKYFHDEIIPDGHTSFQICHSCQMSTFLDIIGLCLYLYAFFSFTNTRWPTTSYMKINLILYSDKYCIYKEIT